MTDTCPHRYFGVAWSGDEPYARCVGCDAPMPWVRVHTLATAARATQRIHLTAFDGWTAVALLAPEADAMGCVTKLLGTGLFSEVELETTVPPKQWIVSYTEPQGWD